MCENINQTQIMPGKKISSPWSQGNSWQENHQNKQLPSLSPSCLFILPCYLSGFPDFPRIPFPPKKSERHFFFGFQNWCSFPTQSLADLILTLTYLFSLSKFQVCVPEVSLDAGRISSPTPGNFGRVQKWNMYEEFNQKLPRWLY